MKTISTLHFSSYPPPATKPQQRSKQIRSNLTVVRLNTKEVKPRESDLANNPTNWDESWFCNYE